MLWFVFNACIYTTHHRANFETFKKKCKFIVLLSILILRIYAWIEMDEKLLSQISQTAGVDFKQLHQKWMAVSQQQNINQKQKIGDQNPDLVSMKSSEPASSHTSSHLGDVSRLDDYQICVACNGTGFSKEIYNHMILEKTCKSCDGECIQLKLQESSGSN